MTFALGDLVGRVRLDTSELGKAGEQADGFSGKLRGLATAAGVVAAGTAIEEFSRRSVDKFKEVGGEVNQLVRTTGGLPEEMSRLRFAAVESGVGTDTLSRSLVLLGKNMETHLDKLKATGIAFTDAHGKTLPLNDSLLNISEKFKSMPNGIEKNTLAMELFGRQGTQLIPFLNKGRDGLGELEKQADKLGLTLGSKDLDALKKNAQAHKEFNAAIEGVQVQLGAKLLPVLTRFTEIASAVAIPAVTLLSAIINATLRPALEFIGNILDKSVIPAVSSAAQWLSGELQRGLQVASDAVHVFTAAFDGKPIASATGSWQSAVASVGAAIKGVFDDVNAALTLFMDGFDNPHLREAADSWQSDVVIVGQKIRQALDAIGGFIKGSVIPAFGALADFVGDHWKGVLSGAADVVTGALRALWDFVFNTLVPDVRGGLQTLADKFQEFKTKHAPQIEAIREAFGHFKDSVQHDVIPRLQDLGTYLSNTLLPAAEDVAKTFTDNLAPALGGISVAAGITLITTLGNVAQALESIKITAFVGGITSALGALRSAVTAGGIAGGLTAIKEASVFGVPLPILAAAAAVGALAGAAIYAYQHFQRFRDIVHEVSDALSTAFAGAVQFLTSNVIPAVNTVVSFILTQFGHLVSWFQTEWPAIQEAVGHVFVVIKDIIEGAMAIIGGVLYAAFEVLKAAWNLFGANILAIVSDVWNLIAGTIQNAISVIEGVVQLVLDLINGDWSKSGEDLKQIVGAIWSEVGLIFSTALSIIGELVRLGLRLLLSAFEALGGLILHALEALPGLLWQLFTGALSLAVTAVLDGIAWLIVAVITIPVKMAEALAGLGVLLWHIADAAWHMFLDATVAVGDAVTRFVFALPGRLVGFFTALPGELAGVARSAWSFFTSETESGGNRAVGFIQGIPGRLAGALGDVGHMLFDAGKKIIQGLIDGMGAAFDALGRKIADATNIVKSHLPFSPAKVGPLSGSGNPFFSGQSIVNMLADGMNTRIPSLAASAARVANTISSGMGAPADIGVGASGAASGNVAVGTGYETTRNFYQTINAVPYTPEQVMAEAMSGLKMMETVHG